MRTIELTDYTVKILEKDDLTYADIEGIQKHSLSGVTLDGQGEVKDINAQEMLGAKRHVAEQMVEEVKDEDGEDVGFSQEWLDELPAEDGMKFMDAVEEETEEIGKKKT